VVVEQPSTSLWREVEGLVYFGWAVAMIRYALEFVAPTASMYVGVYYAMPLALLYCAIRRKLDHLSWPRLALAMILMGVCVWLVPNAIAYTTGQFLGWQHGRFTPQERSAPVAETALGKVTTALTVAGATTIAGSLWSILWATVLIWVPRTVRQRGSTEP
jgi:hypothetical protein